MTPLFFFLAGIPSAFLVSRAIQLLVADFGDDEDEQGAVATATTALFWQVGAWPSRVRFVVSAMAPPFMALAAMQFEPVQATAVSVFILALLVCTGTDLIVYRVPNLITYPGTALALLAAVAMPNGDPIGAAIASLGAGGIFFALALITRGGMGLGDVKLAVFIGAALGLQGAYSALIIGVLAGGATILLLLALRVVTRRQGVPYAPFLALAAIGVVLHQGAAFAPL